jgi:diguanylate cyclase (GGDEF)-like protein
MYLSLTISGMFNTANQMTGVAIIARDITQSVLVNEHLRGLKSDLEVEKNKMEHVLNLEDGLNTILHLDKLLDFIVQKTALILEAQRCSILLFDEATQELCVRGNVGLDDSIASQSRVKWGEPIAGMIAQEDQPILVTNIEIDHRFRCRNKVEYKHKSFMGAPVKLEGRLIGVMCVSEKEPEQSGVFTESDVKILRMIANHVAIAIESAKLHKELNFLTITDPLTNIYNYRYFIKSLDHEIKRSKRYHNPLCLLFMDVDDFKSYNHELGMMRGDVVLKEIGRLLSQHLRDVDVACRYSADEFAVILPSTDLLHAHELALRLQRKVSGLPLPKPITISIGIAQYCDDMSRHDLILKADMALLSSKKDGKSHIAIY